MLEDLGLRIDRAWTEDDFVSLDLGNGFKYGLLFDKEFGGRLRKWKIWGEVDYLVWQ